MKILGKDNNLHVVERPSGDKERLTGAELKAELDAMSADERANVRGLPPEFAPEPVKKKSAGVVVIGRDNNLHVVEVDGERRHVNDIELAALKAGKAVGKMISGPPETKDVKGPEEAKTEEAETEEAGPAEDEGKPKKGK